MAVADFSQLSRLQHDSAITATAELETRPGGPRYGVFHSLSSLRGDNGSWLPRPCKRCSYNRTYSMQGYNVCNRCFKRAALKRKTRAAIPALRLLTELLERVKGLPPMYDIYLGPTIGEKLVHCRKASTAAAHLTDELELQRGLLADMLETYALTAKIEDPTARLKAKATAQDAIREQTDFIAKLAEKHSAIMNAPADAGNGISGTQLGVFMLQMQDAVHRALGDDTETAQRIAQELGDIQPHHDAHVPQEVRVDLLLGHEEDAAA